MSTWSTGSPRPCPRCRSCSSGPMRSNRLHRSRLAANKNVELLGARRHADVPAYLQHADVIVVPHLVSSFTESLDPIKAYECLAVGRPTVATPIAGFRGLPTPVSVADAEGFADAVRAALAASPAPEPSGVPTWTERGREFADALARARNGTTACRRLSVVFLDHCAQLSGAELALLRLLPALDVDAHVILGEDGPLVQRLKDVGTTVEVMEMAPAARDVRRGSVRPSQLPLRSAAATVAYTWRVARRLRQLRPDLVHTNSLKAAYYGAISARLAGRPVLVHVRDRVADDYLPRPAVLLTRALVRVLPSAVIANSHATLETLRLPRRRSSVVLSPVVHDAVAAHPRVRQRQDRPTTIAMVGRLSPWKGQDVFLRSFAAAFPDGNERARGRWLGLVRRGRLGGTPRAAGGRAATERASRAHRVSGRRGRRARRGRHPGARLHRARTLRSGGARGDGGGVGRDRDKRRRSSRAHLRWGGWGARGARATSTRLPRPFGSWLTTRGGGSASEKPPVHAPPSSDPIASPPRCERSIAPL